MENKSFLSKFIFLLIILVLIGVSVFFFLNKQKVDADMKDVGVITSMNVDTYDEDLYVYKLDNDILYASSYFYNSYYLSNNEVEFDEYKIDDNTKFYLKTLSNTGYVSIGAEYIRETGGLGASDFVVRNSLTGKYEYSEDIQKVFIKVPNDFNYVLEEIFDGMNK